MNFRTDSHARYEKGTPGERVSGYYTWREGDQEYRVDYTADEKGYKPVVSSKTYVAEDAPAVTESKVQQPIPNVAAIKPEAKKPLAIDAVKLELKKPTKADSEPTKTTKDDSSESIVVEAFREPSEISPKTGDSGEALVEFDAIINDLEEIVKEERELKYYDSLHGVIERTAENKDPRMEIYLRDLLKFEVTEIGAHQLQKKLQEQDESDPVTHLMGHLNHHSAVAQFRSGDDNAESKTDDELSEDEQLWKVIPLLLPRESLLLSPKEKFLKQLLNYEKKQGLYHEKSPLQKSDNDPVDHEVYIRTLLATEEAVAVVEKEEKKPEPVAHSKPAVSKIVPVEVKVNEPLRSQPVYPEHHYVEGDLDIYQGEEFQSQEEQDELHRLFEEAYDPSKPESREEQIFRYFLINQMNENERHELQTKSFEPASTQGPQLYPYHPQHPYYRDHNILPYYYGQRSPQYNYVPYQWAYPSYNHFAHGVYGYDDEYMSDEEWEYHRLVAEENEKRKQLAALQPKPSRM